MKIGNEDGKRRKEKRMGNEDTVVSENGKRRFAFHSKDFR